MMQLFDEQLFKYFLDRSCGDESIKIKLFGDFPNPDNSLACKEDEVEYIYNQDFKENQEVLRCDKIFRDFIGYDKMKLKKTFYVFLVNREGFPTALFSYQQDWNVAPYPICTKLYQRELSELECLSRIRTRYLSGSYPEFRPWRISDLVDPVTEHFSLKNSFNTLHALFFGEESLTLQRRLEFFTGLFNSDGTRTLDSFERLYEEAGYSVPNDHKLLIVEPLPDDYKEKDMYELFSGRADLTEKLLEHFSKEKKEFYENKCRERKNKSRVLSTLGTSSDSSMGPSFSSGSSPAPT